MDFQNGIVERFGEPPALERAAAAARTAREAGVPVILVRVAFREGYPEASAANKSFSRISATGGMELESPATQIPDEIGVGPDDIVVVKKRVSAFAGSDLDVVLRSLEVGTLVLGGIATSGVVLSTLRQAADLDYGLVVLEDACADADDEVHRVLTTKVFPRQADVVSTEEWIGGLSRAPGPAAP